MLKRFCLPVFLIAFMLCTASRSRNAEAQSPATPMDEMKMGHPKSAQIQPTSPLKVTNGTQTADWTPANLAALPHVTIKAYNDHAKTDQTYSGVLLSTLLTKVGLPEKPHGAKDLSLYLIAEGADGYHVVYSIGEVNANVHDSTVIVADALDGKPLGDSGPFQLVASGEKHPARWVRNLVAVRVLAAK